MKVVIEPQHMKGPGINIHGPQVTPLVWDLFNYAIASNRLSCPWYAARQKAGAFFQGGSDRRDGQWVFIEFWQSPDKCGDFMHLINSALSFLDDAGKPVDVFFDSPSTDLVKRFKGLANFYEYPVTATGETGYTFTPTDANAITTMVEMNILNPGLFTPVKSS